MAQAKKKAGSAAVLNKAKNQLAAAKKKAVSEYHKDVKQLEKQIKKQIESAKKGFSKIKELAETAARTDASLASKLAQDGLDAMKSALDSAHVAMSASKKELSNAYDTAKAEAKKLAPSTRGRKPGSKNKKKDAAPKAAKAKKVAKIGRAHV